MGVIMGHIASILIAILGSDRAMEYIITMLDTLRKRPDNAVDDEYVELQAKSLRQRIIDNKRPIDKNVMLEQAAIDRIKKAHRRGKK